MCCRAVPWTILLLTTAASAAPPSGEPVYETTVRGRRVETGPPAEDPSGFTTVVDLEGAAPGAQLADLLAEVPGLRIRSSGAGGPQTISLRAAGSHQVMVYLDGVRLTAPGGGGFDLSLLDPFHLELAEVRRSGGSVHYGALGGAVLLKTPRLRSRRRSTMAIGYGSWDTVGVRAARGEALGRWRYAASGSFRRSAGDFPFVDDNGVARLRENNRSEIGELLLKVDRLGTGLWHVGLLENLALARRGAPGMMQLPSVRAEQRDLRQLVALRASRFDLLRAGDRLDLNISHRYGFFRFEEPDAPPVLARSHRHAVAVGGQLRVPLDAVGALDAGVELRADLLHEPDTGDRPRRFATDLWLASRGRLLGRALILIPSVRLALANDFAATVVPELGLVARPLDWTKNRWLGPLELLGNVGRRYRLPSFEELYLRFEGYSSNPQLQPEDALAADAGLRWRGELLTTELAYFRRRIKRTILFAPVSPTRVQADNYSGVRVQGLESALSVRPGLCLALRAAYTLTRTRFGAAQSRLPGHPEHRFVGRVSWSGGRCPVGQLRGEFGRLLGGLQLWSGVTVDSAMVLGPLDSLAEEGRVLLSVGASYRYRRLRLTAEGRNLLDKRDAVDTVGFPLPPARFFAAMALSI